jgi:hypothetical protein
VSQSCRAESSAECKVAAASRTDQDCGSPRIPVARAGGQRLRLAITGQRPGAIADAQDKRLTLDLGEPYVGVGESTAQLRVARDIALKRMEILARLAENHHLGT